MDANGLDAHQNVGNQRSNEECHPPAAAPECEGEERHVDGEEPECVPAHSHFLLYLGSEFKG